MFRRNDPLIGYSESLTCFSREAAVGPIVTGDVTTIGTTARISQYTKVAGQTLHRLKET